MRFVHHVILHFESKTLPTFRTQTCSRRALGIFVFALIVSPYLTAVYAFTRNGVGMPGADSTCELRGV
jgi:hypothetical protein